MQDFEGSTWRITRQPVRYTEFHQLHGWLSKGGGDSWVMIKPKLCVEFHGAETFYQPCLSLQEARC